MVGGREGWHLLWEKAGLLLDECYYEAYSK